MWIIYMILMMAQVGNPAFADYVDANLHLTHVNNMEDPIPIVPGIGLGFAQREHTDPLSVI